MALDVTAKLFHLETGRWPRFKDAEPQEEHGEYMEWIRSGNGRIVQIVLLTIEAIEEQRGENCEETCPDCGGMGVITNWDEHTVNASAWPPDNEKPCQTCQGKGSVTR